MNTMLLALLSWLIFNACVLSIADNNPYTATPWKNLDHSDIFQFALNTIGEKLSNASLRVVPHPNTPYSPLNKFVGVDTIHERIKHVLPKDATVEFNAPVEPEFTKELLIMFVERMNFFLDFAMQERLRLLVELQNIRVNHEFKLTKGKIEELLKHLTFDNIDHEVSIQKIMSHIRESDLSNEVKKVMCYPSVKEELSRIMSNDFSDNQGLLAIVIETLMPFVREGLEKSDTNAVNQYDAEAAANALTELLVPQYKSMIKDAILKGNLLDAVLSDANKENTNFFTDMEEKITIRIRQTISILKVDHNNKESTDFCASMRWKIFGISASSLRHNLEQKINIAMEQEEPYLVFVDHNSVKNLEFRVRNKVRTRIDKECYIYNIIEQSFSKENSTALAEYVVQRIKTEYKVITAKEIEILKGYIPDIRDYNSYYHASNVDLNLPIHLKYLQNDIEKESINTYGFLPGMFIYSKPYFDVMDTAFSKFFQTVGQDYKVFHKKTEL